MPSEQTIWSGFGPGDIDYLLDQIGCRPEGLAPINANREPSGWEAWERLRAMLIWLRKERGHG